MDRIDKRLGTVIVLPEGEVVAGTMMEWTFIYTAGSYGVDEGGTLMLVQRIAADMQKPQFEFKDQAAFTTVTTNANCRLSYRFQPKQYVRPWQKWCLVIDILDGSIYPGETISIVLGDRSQGSPGIRAQSFVESGHEFKFLIDPTNAASPKPLPSSPVVPIVANQPMTLECLVPVQLRVNEKTRIFVKGVDAWGNPTPCPGKVHLTTSSRNKVVLDGSGLKAIEPGIVYIDAFCGDMACKSNPLQIVAADTKLCRYWGDLHAQTDSTVGTGSEDDYFTFARNQARLDFVGHQGNDFQLTDEDWACLNRVVKAHNKPGKFIILPGYEWSGNTSAGGDHNVIYNEDDQPIFRSSHWQVPEVPEDDVTPAHPADALFSKLRKNGKAMVIPHIGGRPANVRAYFDSEIEHVVEILSCHGIFEWLLWDALDEGYKVGVVCNSDGHKGRPGAEGPGAGQFGIGGGLTCVFAQDLSRDGIFNAIKERRCYGTTGARIHLWVEADGHMMGEEFTCDKDINFSAEVHGTGAIEKLILMCGQTEIQTFRPISFNNLTSSRRVRISWGGAKMRGRGRRATWDGQITVKKAKIEQASIFAFDSPADGITEQDSHKLEFRSSTTGDMDGIDLYLDSASQGILSFSSPIGKVELDLSTLASEPHITSFGGLDLHVNVERYPEQLDTKKMMISHKLIPEQGITSPYLVKVVQEDGHIAWSSPIFVTQA